MNKFIKIIEKYKDTFGSLPLLFQFLIMSGITFYIFIITAIIDIWII